MEIKSKEIKLIEIEKIIENPKNANRHDIDQIKTLEKIIKKVGFRQPLIISNRSGFLVAGHCRLLVAKNIGMKEVPVIFQDFENEAEEYAFLVGDNEIAKRSELDMQSVYDNIKEFPDLDIELLGIEDFSIPEVEIEPQADEDEVPELKQEPITKRGDVWILGNHRLMCGDSTMIDNVEKLMNGEKADMVFTDPPYNVAVVGGCKNPLDPNYQSGKTIKNDKMTDEDFYTFLCDSYKNMHIATKAGSSCYVAHADLYGHIFRQAFIDSGWQLKQCIIWRKHAFVFSRQDYHWQHEPILYGWKSGESHKFFGERNQSTVWDFNRPSPSQKEHPTMKPVELMEKAINNSSKTGDLLFEPFGGSGSTLIACEKTNRKCYGMELDEHYCDVIINRWQNYTGKEAVLELNGQKYNDLLKEREVKKLT